MTNKKGGGLCLFIREEITYHKVDVNLNNDIAEVFSVIIHRKNQKDRIAR